MVRLYHNLIKRYERTYHNLINNMIRRVSAAAPAAAGAENDGGRPSFSTPGCGVAAQPRLSDAFSGIRGRPAAGLKKV
jgi:hypothetical protein